MFTDLQTCPIMPSLDEIGLIAKRKSTVESRRLVNPFIDDKNTLPIFVSPMSCIIDNINYKEYKNNGFIPIMPVTKYNWSIRESLLNNGEWVSLTKKEFQMWFLDVNNPDNKPYKVLIDTAQGQMESLYKMIKEAKDKWSGLTIMMGNLEEPEAYIDCCEAGVDYVRVSVGTGSGCLTSLVTGFHASLPYILNEIQRIKSKHISQIFDTDDIYYWETDDSSFDWKNKVEEPIKLKCITKVVADGGITNPDRFCKALALGADCVMMGSAFSHTEVACGETRYIGHRLYDSERRYYGQASEQGQIDRFGEVRNTPEGTEIWIPVDTTIKELHDRYEGSLRSALSYNGSNDLENFIGKVKFCRQTIGEYNSYYKK